MKPHAKLAAPADPRGTMASCARLALLLTAVVAIDILVVLPFQRGPEVVALSAAIFVAFAVVIWSSSLALGVIAVAAEKAMSLLPRLVHGRPKAGVEDDWLDSPA